MLRTYTEDRWDVLELISTLSANHVSNQYSVKADCRSSATNIRQETDDKIYVIWYECVKKWFATNHAKRILMVGPQIMCAAFIFVILIDQLKKFAFYMCCKWSRNVSRYKWWNLY